MSLRSRTAPEPLVRAVVLSSVWRLGKIQKEPLKLIRNPSGLIKLTTPAIRAGQCAACVRIQQPPKQVELRLHLGCGCGPSHSERGLESRERVAEDLGHLVEGKG